MKLSAGMGMLGAVVAALLLNVILFGSAALLSQIRPVQQDISDPVAINLISLKPPAPPPPEQKKEIPKPKQKPLVDFTPQLFQPGIAAPGPMDVQVALDPSLFAGDLQRGSFIYDSTDLDQPPREVVRQQPLYPYRARQRNIQGWVKVELLVRADGSVGNVKVMASEPSGVFDSAVIKAVPQWKFQPGVMAGERVPSRVVTTIRFELGR